MIKRTWLSFYSVILIALVLLQGCTTLVVSNHTNFEARSQGSPQTIRIAHIADIHHDPDSPLLERTVSRVNQLQPDVFCITGDFIGYETDLDILFTELSKIDSRIKTYAVPGNWEYWLEMDIQNFEERLNKAGITLLINEAERITIDGRSLYLYGLDDYLGGKPDLAPFLPAPGESCLVLAHCPVLADEVDRKLTELNHQGPVLVLSGHTHGGQITFFGLPLILPPGSAHYVKGLYRLNRCMLHVTKGLGTSRIDLRIFSSPTVDLLQF